MKWLFFFLVWELQLKPLTHLKEEAMIVERLPQVILAQCLVEAAAEIASVGEKEKRRLLCRFSQILRVCPT